MKDRYTLWIKVIDVLLVGIIAGIILYAIVHPQERILKIAITVGVVVFVVLFLLRPMTRRKRRPQAAGAAVVKLILLDDDGERVKEWYIEGETSLLIGKNSQHGEVDIDLSEAEYAALISQEHAVLNRWEDAWYLEDIDSASGTGIREAGKSKARKLAYEQPQRIGPGDLIYIANTRLLVK